MKMNLTLREKVGQLFFVRCPGGEKALHDIDRFSVGGYLLFGADFKNSTPELLADTVRGYQKHSKTPLFIGSDEEGGSVTRASFYPQFRSERFKSPMALLAEGGETALLDDIVTKSAFLKSLGINVNFAPVCDVTDDRDSFIYTRTLGLTAGETARIIAAMIKKMDECKIGSMLKHFPGYGDNADTHIGLSVDNRSPKQLRERDLIPFASGIAAGADSVLVSHNIVSKIDENHPASLSKPVHDILRGEMGFDRVIITDDLMMDAVSKYTDGEKAAVTAVIAGNDMLCASDYEVQLPAVLKAVEKGIIDENQIDRSLDRIFAWKRKLGLLR